jgi:hypothetical protein
MQGSMARREGPVLTGLLVSEEVQVWGGSVVQQDRVVPLVRVEQLERVAPLERVEQLEQVERQGQAVLQGPGA